MSILRSTRHAYNHSLQVEAPVVEGPSTRRLERLFSRLSNLVLELLTEVPLENTGGSLGVTDKDLGRRQLTDVERQMVAIYAISGGLQEG